MYIPQILDVSFNGSDPFSDAMWLIAPRHSPDAKARHSHQILKPQFEN